MKKYTQITQPNQRNNLNPTGSYPTILDININKAVEYSDYSVPGAVEGVRTILTPFNPTNPMSPLSIGTDTTDFPHPQMIK